MKKEFVNPGGGGIRCYPSSTCLFFFLGGWWGVEGWVYSGIHASPQPAMALGIFFSQKLKNGGAGVICRVHGTPA